MKTTLKNMMVIGMILIGTVPTFGKTTITVNNNRSHFGIHTTVVNKECRLRHMHDRTCGGMVVKDTRRPMLDKTMLNHIIKGNHNFDRHDVCKKCNMTRSEIRRIEREVVSDRPTTYPMPRPHR